MNTLRELKHARLNAGGPRAGADVALDQMLDDYQDFPNTVVFGFGGTGMQVGTRLIALGVAEQRVPVVYGMDTATSAAVEVWSGGRTIRMPREQVLCLAETDRQQAATRSEALERSPLLRQRSETLLRGIPLTLELNELSTGSGGFPAVGALEFDLAIEHVRHHVRAGLAESCQAHAALGIRGDRRLRRRVPDQDTPFRPQVFLTASGCGGAGSPAILKAGYTVREEAKRLRLPDPEIWLLLLGPSIYRGFTDRTDINYAATLRTLDYLARHGLRGYQWPDGSVTDQILAPANHILLMDAPRLTTDPTSEPPTTTETDLAYWRAAAALYQLLRPTVRRALVETGRNPRRGDPAAPLRAGIFSVLYFESLGVDREGTTELLATRLAEQWAQDLQRRLAAG